MGGQPVTSVEVAVTPPYRVTVGAGLLENLGQMVEESTVVVVSDSQVAPLYGARLCRSLIENGRRVESIAVPAGESSKSLEQLGGLVRRLAQLGVQRDAAIVSLGGGVVSDLAGFAAASYLRGVRFYSCPTSLLAMVDASVGGKTGINLPEGKNLMGAFWQPAAVVADVSTLATLPGRLFRDGAVELFKHGLLQDGSLLEALTDPQFSNAGNPDVLERYIALSVAVKASVVAADEREAGSRAHLNLGHTLAHALEAATEHQLPHGAAVAYGLHYAALLGSARGWYDFTPRAQEIVTWLVPPPLPAIEFDELHRFMLRDKKNRAASQRFVLLKGEAQPVVVDDVEPMEQRAAWERLKEVYT